MPRPRKTVDPVKLIELWTQRLTQPEIAQALGVSVPTMVKAAKSLGLSTKKRNAS